MIKTSRLMCGPETISFYRFFLGIFFLIAVFLVKKRRPVWTFSLLLLAGAACKALHYMGENYGVSQGYSYGGIIVWPAQTVFLALAEIFIYKEKISKRNLLSILLCLTGIATISWNGADLDAFLTEQLPLTIVFLFAALGSALFTMVQKKLLGEMDTLIANLSMFSMASVITFPPAILSGNFYLGFRWDSAFCLMCLGAITGITFLMISDSMKTVPIYLVPVIQSTTVIFTILWAILFMHEPVTRYIVIGSAVFLVGLIMVKKEKA